MMTHIDEAYAPNKWAISVDDAAVVVSNVYEGQFSVRISAGLESVENNVGTDLAPVVDVMVSGRIIKGIPIRILKRLT